MIDKNEIIEKISEETVLNILAQHNIQPYSVKNNEIWFQTFCHCGDSHKLCYYRDSKTFYCYTNCGSLNLFNIIMILNDCDFKTSLKYLASCVGINTRRGFNQTHSFTEQSNKENTYLAYRKQKNNNEENVELLTYPESVLNYFEPDMFYEGWINEGISPQVMHDFNIRWYNLQESIIIPHYNAAGQLVGIRRRTLNEDELAAKRKYCPLILEQIQYAHPLGLNLYGLWQNKNAIIKHKRVFIYEAEKSVLLSHTFYGENDCSVAVCGFNISNYQVKELLKLGINEVVLGFDKDYDVNDFINADTSSPEYKAYERYIHKIQTMAYKFTSYCKTYVLFDNKKLLQLKDSPVDRGKEIFETLYKNKIEITTDTKIGD